MPSRWCPATVTSTPSIHPTPFDRRRFFRAALAVSALSAGAACGTTAATAPSVHRPAPAPDTPFAGLDITLAELEDRHSVRLGVHVVDPRRELTYTRRADERFALCSTFKVYAVAALLRQEQQGRLSLHDRVRIEPDEVVENSPVTEPAQGRAVALGELCKAALTRSDNTAANLILGRLGGPRAITEFARTLGDNATVLNRWEPALNSAERGDLRDTTTPTGLGIGYRELLLGAALTPARQRTLTDWMLANVTSGERIRKGLPDGWTSADKTGAGSYGTVNDAGVVRSPNGDPLLFILLSDSTTNLPDAPNNNVPLAEATTAIVTALST